MCESVSGSISGPSSQTNDGIRSVPQAGGGVPSWYESPPLAILDAVPWSRHARCGTAGTHGRSVIRMTKLPGRFSAFLRDYPDVGDAYRSLGDATMAAGPLDAKTAQLVKLGIAIGLRHEGAVHAHCRKALERGCTEDEIRHAAVLATTTMGFPSMMAALSWVDDVLVSDRD